MRVVQVGDVAAVAPALAAALDGRVEMTLLPMAQPGARWPTILKPLAFPLRYREAKRVAGAIRESMSDLVHIHWLPNALAATVEPDRMPPWVLHVHGDDIRGVRGWRLPHYVKLLRQANAVVFSTPDLAPIVRHWRPDAQWLPAPIPPQTIHAVRRYDVLVNAQAHPQKGSRTAFAALRLIHAADPSLRLAAMEGAAYEQGPWDCIQRMPKEQFHSLLAGAGVVIGQFATGALGIADLETMALNRPLVTWVQSGTYKTVPPISNARNPQEIADAVLSNPTQRGADWVASEHSPESVAEKAMAVYASVAAVDLKVEARR